jgi:hypothetical protein
VTSSNPYEPPAARVADRHPGAPSVLPRVAAVLAFLFAGVALFAVILRLVGAPVPVRNIDHLNGLATVLAASSIALGLWRRSAWAWWAGLLGGGWMLALLALRLRQAGGLAPGPDSFFGLLVMGFLCILLLPRTIRAFTRSRRRRAAL